MNNIKKWSPIMEALDITDEAKIAKMSEYAENFIKMESTKSNISPFNTSGVSGNLLPINLRIMKDLDNFEITTDASKTQNFTYNIKIDNDTYPSLTSLDQLESVLIHTIIEDLKDKDILIYSLVDNMFVMKIDNEFSKLVISSRIKKN
jgi:nitrogen regulatory protein PII-like uncharacterized protein